MGNVGKYEESVRLMCKVSQYFFSRMPHLVFLYIVLILMSLFATQHAEASDDYYILFTSDRDEITVMENGKKTTKHEIYRMNTDGSDQKRLTSNENDEKFIKPMPNSNLFSYTLYDEDDGNLIGAEIIISDSEGNEIDFFDKDFDNFSIFASIDISLGMMISAEAPIIPSSAKEEDTELWITNFESRDRVRITDNSDWEGWPALSPDGNSVVYLRYDTNYTDWLNPGQLYFIDLKDRKETRISEDFRFPYYHPVFSPNGDFIATSKEVNFESTFMLYSWPDLEIETEMHKSGICRNYEFTLNGELILINCGEKLYIMDIYNDFEIKYANDADLKIDKGTFSPDGKTIYFTATKKNQIYKKDMEIYKMSIDGENIEQLTENEYFDGNITIIQNTQ